MLTHSAVSATDVPTEEPFNDDINILDGVKASMEMTPDGNVPVINLLQTTAISHVTPTSDVGQYPGYLKYFEIVKMGDLKAQNSLPLNVNLCARVAHYAKLFLYFRPNFLIRLDIRAPIGSNYQIKSFAIPANNNLSNSVGAELGYPGHTFWVSEQTTTYYRVNFSQPTYLVADPSELVSTFCFNVISSITREGNPEPMHYTLSVCIPELQCSVIRSVPLSSGSTDLMPPSRIAIEGKTVYNMVDGEVQASFLWSLLGLGLGLGAEIIFPGSGPVVRALTDFLVTKFVTGYATPQVVPVHTGDVLEFDVDPEGFVRFSINTGPKERFYVEVDGASVLMTSEMVGRQLPLSSSMSFKSFNSYNQSIFTMSSDPNVPSTEGSGLRWPDGESPLQWANLSNALNYGDAVVCQIGKIAPASPLIMRTLNPHLTTIEDVTATNFQSVEIYPGAPVLVPDAISPNFTIAPQCALFTVTGEFEHMHSTLSCTLTSLAIIVYNFSGQLRATLGWIEGAKIATAEDMKDAGRVEDFKVQLTRSNRRVVCITAQIVSRIDEGLGPMWLPDDWWGGDATGAYLGWSKPMTFNYSTQGTDRDTPAVETFNEMSVAVNSSQDVSFDFWTRGPPSNFPRFQAPNQPSAVSPDNTGVNPGGTDKDAGAASVDVSAISSPATITNTAPNTSARPLGMSHVAVDADKEIMVPFRTFKIEENTRVISKISPYYWASTNSTSPTHAQLEALRHAYVGPRDVSSRSMFAVYKLTSVANAFTNIRLIIAQVPPRYTPAQVAAFSIQELSQFNRKEHVVHGPETIINTEWMLPVPIMNSYDPDFYNGYIVIQVLEYTKNTDSSDPYATLWVRPGNNLTYSIPIAPLAFKTPADHLVVSNFKEIQNRILHFVANSSNKSLLDQVDKVISQFISSRDVTAMSIYDQLKTLDLNNNAFGP